MVADSNFIRFDRASEILRAIAHPVRLAIIDLLYRHKALPVKDIQETLDIGQAVASHHLKILRFNQVVNTQRKGRFTFYSLLHEDYQLILELLQSIKEVQSR